MLWHAFVFFCFFVFNLKSLIPPLFYSPDTECFYRELKLRKESAIKRFLKKHFMWKRKIFCQYIDRKRDRYHIHISHIYIMYMYNHLLIIQLQKCHWMSPFFSTPWSNNSSVKTGLASFTQCNHGCLFPIFSIVYFQNIPISTFHFILKKFCFGHHTHTPTVLLHIHTFVH